MRYVPDVAMHGSILDAYVIQVQGKIFYVSGTSAATPSLASVMALIVENAAAAQGNANPALYKLATQQLSSNGTPIFHDITTGNNSVPGVAGFNAGPGYDPVTGLGSVDAALLVNHWNEATRANFTLIPNVSSVSVTQASSTAVTLTLIAEGNFNSRVTLAASGAPSGVTVQFSSSTLTAAAPVTVTFRAASTAAAGKSTITISGTGGGLTRTATIAVTIVASHSFSLLTSATKITVPRNGSMPITVSTTALNGFKSAIALSVTTLPKGVIATFAPASVPSPGIGRSMLTLRASSTTPVGTYTLTVTATGAGVTKTQPLTLTVK